jgi:acyl-CoA synthetase (NDP forming)/RimJ/RimL family protein N-acetyltransferase
MFRIIPDGLAFKEHVLLKDGQGILLRPARPEDVPLVESFMKRVSKESLRMRFMVSMNEVPRSVVEDLCHGDFVESGCLLAVSSKGKTERIIGLGNFIRMGHRLAEVAFMTEEAFQGLGISTLILERLAGLAAAKGYVELEAEVLPDNQPMLSVFKNSGFKVHQVWDSDTVHLELPVNNAAALWERAGLRERIAVANSLVPLLKPKVVAVIGASRDQDSIGNMMFRHILTANFKGTVYPVNKEADSVNGVKAYAAIHEIPESIDLAVIAVPAETVLEVAEQAIGKGAKGLVVVTAGFAEAGEAGAKRQKELVGLSETNGVRLLGPSCLGLMNTHPEVRLNASLSPELTQPGSAGFFSHSAALGLVIQEYATKRGIGFSSFVSAGNRADVSGNDLLQYWEEDPQTQMALLYLETFRNPRRFVRIARRMSYKKPVLCVKSARSHAGRAAAEGKSGLLTGGRVQVEALLHQTGIIFSETLEEMFDAALVLSHQPLPQGNKVAIVANSTGVATLFADSAAAHGLELAGPGLVDLGAFTDPQSYENAVYNALKDEAVHALLVGFACVGSCGPRPVEQAIRAGIKRAQDENGMEKPVLLCLMGAEGSLASTRGEERAGTRALPAFLFPESASRALGKVVQYVHFRNKPQGEMVWVTDADGEQARSTARKLVDAAQESELIEVGAEQISQILKAFGLKEADAENSIAAPVTIAMESDRLFGPLIRLTIAEGLSVVRITPLTANDLEEMLEDVRFDGHPDLATVLGRISQMIEEIPWLWDLTFHVRPGASGCEIVDTQMHLKPGSGFRPLY